MPATCALSSTPVDACTTAVEWSPRGSARMLPRSCWASGRDAQSSGAPPSSMVCHLEVDAHLHAPRPQYQSKWL
eukprot:6811317-Prymnesium_polylepis.3